MHGAVAGAVEALLAKPTRGTDGRFVAGTPAAVTSGATSEQLSALLEPARKEIAERTLSDLALTNGEAAETMRRLVEAHAEVSLLRESVFIQIGRLEGPVSGKGKVRALLSSYLSLVDREARLALAIGLDRKSRRIDLARAFAEQERNRG